MRVRDVPAVLTYSVTPNEVPCSGDAPSRVDLQVRVTNGTGKPVTCAQLGFVVPVGQGATDLTGDVTIDAVASAGTAWSIAGPGDGTFTAQPDLPGTALGPGESIGFVLGGVVVDPVPGVAQLGVYEVTAATGRTVVAVTKATTSLGITRFRASPLHVVPGGTVTLAWATTGADSCTLSWAGEHRQVATSGEATVTPEVETTYALTATSGHGTVVQQVTVTVARVQIPSFTASPRQIALGTTSTLRWEVINAVDCTLDPGAHPVDPVHGTLTVAPLATTTYTLEASGRGEANDDSRPTVVDVVPVSVTSFTADPPRVNPGGTSTLAWSTAWASPSGVTLDPGGFTVPAGGTHPVTVQASTTYTLRAAGYAGPAVATTTVEVVRPVATKVGFTTDPSRPGHVTLHWEVTAGAASLAATGAAPVPLDPVGSRLVAVDRDTLLTLVVTMLGWSGHVQLSFPYGIPAGAAQLSSLELASPAGVGSPNGAVTVSWAARAQGVAGYVGSAGGSRTIGGSAGSQGIVVGGPDAQDNLWHGFLSADTAGVGPLVWWFVSAVGPGAGA